MTPMMHLRKTTSLSLVFGLACAFLISGVNVGGPRLLDGPLDPDLPPSGNFELIDWKLDIPQDSSGNGIGDVIQERELSSGYVNREHFYTAPDGGMVFVATVAGGKTSSGTSYTRSELREMLRRGNTSVSTTSLRNCWAFSAAPTQDQNVAAGVNGVLSATLKVDHVTTTGSSGQIGRVIIGQIHARNDEPARLYYRKLPGNSKGSIYLAHEPLGDPDIYFEMIGRRGSSAADPEDGIALGEVFSYQIKVEGHKLTVTIQRPGRADVVQVVNMSESRFSRGGDYMYFKAGAYNQNNTGQPSDYCKVTFYRLHNEHDGYDY